MMPKPKNTKKSRVGVQELERLEWRYCLVGSVLPLPKKYHHMGGWSLPALTICSLHGWYRTDILKCWWFPQVHPTSTYLCWIFPLFCCSFHLAEYNKSKHYMNHMTHKQFHPKKCKQKPYCSLGQQSWLYQQKPAGFGAWTLDVLDLSCLKKSWHKHTLRRCPRCKWWSRSRFCCWSTSLVPGDFSSTVWGSCSRLNDLATNTSVFHWEIMCRFTKHGKTVGKSEKWCVILFFIFFSDLPTSGISPTKNGCDFEQMWNQWIQTSNGTLFWMAINWCTPILGANPTTGNIRTMFESARQQVRGIVKIWFCWGNLSTKNGIWRFVKMSVPGFVEKTQFHACRLMFAFKKHDLPWWRENVEILRYLWKSF